MHENIINKTSNLTLHSTHFAMKYICSAVILFLFTGTGLAQDRSNYQLLWKIQKEGKSTGYLFGTMHVNDEEVYDMSDSVLICLDRCEQVAFELDFDELTENVFSDLVQSYADNKYNVELYEKDSESLSVEPVVPIDEFLPPTNQDTDEEITGRKKGRKKDKITLFDSDADEDDEEPSKFTSPLDLYLHSRAKFHGQKIIGLEVIEDQMRTFIRNRDEEEIEELPDSVLRSEFLKYVYEESKHSTKSSHDQLTEIYHRGDIQQIDSLFKFYLSITGKESDFNMTSRNVVMANGIDSLLTSGTLFSAVGAAHLPGQDGVIDLLRKKGYELTPVKATFTGVASKMLEENLTLPGNWIRFRIPDGTFSVEMPKQPEPLQYGNGALTMYMSMDLSTMRIYMNMEQKMYNAGKDKNVIDEVVANIQIMNPNAVIESSEDINTTEGYCKEVYYSIPEGSYRMRLFGKNDRLIMLLCGGAPGGNLQHPDFERFLKSVQIDNLPIHAYLDSDLKWSTYHSPAGSFSVELPGEVKELTQKIKIDNDHFSKIRIVMNEIPAEMGSMHINLLTPSNLMQYSSLLTLNSVTDNFKQESEDAGLEVESTPYTLDGFPATAVTANSNDVTKKMIIGLHGNTAVFIEVDCPKDKHHIFERAISSFRWEPFEPIADRKYTIPDRTASVITFGPMTSLNGGEELDLRFIAKEEVNTWTLNDYRSATYSMLSYETFGPYFFHAYPDSLLLQTAKNNLGWTDSLESKTFSQDRKKLYTVANIDSTKVVHGVYEIHGDRLYSYQIEIPSDWKDVKKITDIIESFTVNYTSDFDISVSRLKENLERIESNPDAEKNYELIQELGDCRVAPSDSTLLLEEWFKNRPDDNEPYSNIYGILTQHVRSLDNIDFIQKAKEKFHTTQTWRVQVHLLQNMLSLNNERALAAYFELYPQLKPLEEDNWEPAPTSYNTDYYTKHLSEILDFSLIHPELADDVLSQLYYSDLGYYYYTPDTLSEEQLRVKKENKASLIREESKIIPLIEVALKLDNPKDYYDPTGPAAYLISQLPTSDRSLHLIDQIKPEKGSLGDYELLRAKKQHGLKISKAQMTSVLESPYGFTLISDLNKNGELSIVPKKYLKQSELDRLYLHYVMSEDDDGMLIKVKLIDEHKMKGNNGEYVIYQYKVQWSYDGGESDNSEFIVGPHRIGEQLTFDIEPYMNYDGFYSFDGSYLSDDDKKKVVEELLKKAISKNVD